ncbi:MAG: protein translocase subunit SecD [Bacillota bacterium]
MRGKNAFKFWSVIIATAILVVFSLSGLSIGKDKVIKSFNDVRTGIDITGGVTALLEPAEGETIVAADLQKNLDSIKASIEVRLDSQGILDKYISTDASGGKGRITVEIPWKAGDTARDPNKLIEESIVVAKLYFQEVKPFSAPVSISTAAPSNGPSPSGKNSSSSKPKVTPKPKASPGASASPSNAPNQYTIKNEGGTYEKVGQILLQGDDIKSASSIYSANEGWHVQLEFSPQGQQKFAQATTTISKNQSLLGIFMDETLISAPRADKVINSSSAIITGTFTQEETKSLSDKIRSGRLPFKLSIVQLDTINATQGQQAYTITIYALLIALALIMLFMIFYYRLPGVFSAVALITHTALQILIISNLGITVTLPGMAGIILSIGLAVDANVIIFARIKEELSSGKTLRASVDAGFKRGFTAVLDGNVTAIIAAGVLWYFGSGAIKSFAITTLIGISLSFITAVTFSRWMLKATSDLNLAAHPWLWGVTKKKIDEDSEEGVAK